MTAPADDLLPGRGDTQGWHRLHKVTPLLRGWKVIVAALVIIGQQRADVFFGGQTELPGRTELLVSLGIAVGFAVLVTLWAVLSWRMTRYRVSGGVLQFNSGVLFRQQRQTRLDRLQAVDVVQPLLGRIFGLSELRLEVAGGSCSDVKLAYLRDQEADELRNALLARAAGVSYEGEQAPVAPEHPLVEVSPGRLIASLALGESTVWLLAGVAAVVLVAVFEPGAVFGMVPMILGVGSATWARFARGFGFRVAHSPDGLRLRHGLLETRTQTVPPGRVQAVLMYQPLLWRRLDWWALRINVAGYASAGEGEGKAPQTVLIPVGTRADALLLVAQVLPDLGVDDPVTVLEDGLTGTAGTRGAAVGSRFLPAPSRARWLDPLTWRRHGVAVTSRALLMRSGRLTHRLILVPNERTQSLGLRQGWLQRRLRLATLVAHSTPGPVNPQVAHLDQEVAGRLLHEQAARARQARAGAGSEQWMSKQWMSKA